MKLLLLPILLALSVGAVSAAQIAHQLPRQDGGFINYTLDAPSGESAGLLVLAQGSGCKPAAASASLATIRAAFPNYTALIVEKSGIIPDSPIEHGSIDCPKDFLDTYTLSGRIDDYQAVLAHIDPTLPGEHVILFGGSEGGLAMEALAARIHPAATVLLSSSVGGTFEEMVLSTVPLEGQASVAAGFEAARASPDSTMLSGHTRRFWADILDHRSSDYLRATDTPLLLIHGGRDTAAVQPVRTLADRFAEEERCNLTYLELPGLDHSMAGPTGRSYLAKIARLAAAWSEQPVKNC